MLRDEEIFYKALNDKMQLTFNKFLRQGTVMESIVQVLVLLLRLRQGVQFLCQPLFSADASQLAIIRYWSPKVKTLTL